MPNSNGSLVIPIKTKSTCKIRAATVSSDNAVTGVLFPTGTMMGFFFRCRVQTGSEAHLASYLMGIRGSFPGGKAAGP